MSDCRVVRSFLTPALAAAVVILALSGTCSGLSVAGTCEMTFTPTSTTIQADTALASSTNIMNMTVNSACVSGAGCNCYSSTSPVTCTLAATFPANAAGAYTISNPSNIAANGGSPSYCSLNYASMITYATQGGGGTNTVEIITVELAGASTLTSTWFYTITVQQAPTTTTTRLPTTSTSSTSTTSTTSTSTTSTTSTVTPTSTTTYVPTITTTADFVTTPAGIAVVTIACLAGAALLATGIYFAVRASPAAKVSQFREPYRREPNETRESWDRDKYEREVERLKRERERLERERNERERIERERYMREQSDL